MDAFLTYAKFHTPEEAKPLIEIIEKEGIPYELDHQVNQLDSVYLGHNLDPMFAIKIPPELFSKLNFLLGEEADKTVSTADDEYYLFSFSDDELIAVVSNPEEWNAYDRTLAQKILSDRKVRVPERKEISPQVPYQPERLKTEWLTIGYLLCTISLGGIFFGLAIVNGRKTLSNGQKVPLYDETTIGHGKTMIALGSLFLIVFLIRLFF
jgi:hypothetical protein